MKSQTLKTSVKRLALLSTTLLAAGCSNTKPAPAEPAFAPPLRSYTPPEGQEPLIEVDDSFEGWNRGTYKFNYGFDKYVFLPIV